MEKVFVEKVNEVYVRVNAEPSTKMEMSSYFEFFVPGYKWMPAYRNKVWDGKVRLLNTMTGLIYYGLIPYIAKFCESRNYELILDKELENINEIPEEYGKMLAKEFDAAFEPREYQNRAVVHGLRHKRALLLSPTASGKSFIIYLIARYHNKHGRRVLTIVQPLHSYLKWLATSWNITKDEN